MQRRGVYVVLGLLILSGLAAPDRGEAWGDVAHQVICELAFQDLMPPARAAVQRLLGTEPDPSLRRFATACTWADHPRQRAPEHYLNLPRTRTRVTAADQACSLAAVCVLTAIAADTAVLKDAVASDADKLAALKFLGHWIGDLHQPLHISFQDDRGGNEVEVRGRCAPNLHAVWDTCLLTQGMGPQPEQIVASLRAELTDRDRQAWTQGDMIAWAEESYHITLTPNVEYCVQVGTTCQYAADNPTFEAGEPKRTVTVDAQYLATHTPTIRSCLLKAGVRLSHVLVVFSNC
jgi:hypothetical protein